ncbi:MAG: AraC family transcriptional regulator [Oscillospiraceae bacterium]|nr:AraC family transcriptional regulator [Oscillospiraceae bacterium]
MGKKLEGILETAEYDVSTLFTLCNNIETADCRGHRHSAIEIIMPLKGSCDVKVNEQAYSLEEFDIIIIPSGASHEVHAPKTAGGRLALQFDFTLLKTVRNLADARYMFYEPRLITHGESPEIHRAVKSLLLDSLDEYEKKREYYEASITAKLISLTILIARKQQENAVGALSLNLSEHLIKRKAHVVNFNRCIEYIHQHYRDDLSLEYVSGISGFSKYHFTRWFKRFAGMSFYDYLTRVRIKVAEAMLINSESPITEIALESGFQSIATFNRVFKNSKNLTPTEFRQTAANNVN